MELVKHGWYNQFDEEESWGKIQKMNRGKISCDSVNCTVIGVW